ncbi:Hypothetical protein NG00_01966 [Corynebacterium camporealensis]|uniref:Uncharacterized protein n=1 Tax=Corynebacterium camporealensis TaxID=161896 RepID=A0A0F6QYG4_9CORY|nr:hypothetical protein [Corynebacterium camporealensis]AKE40130.1 hypothetical protein UL81_10990 [Corynebacterium camporealensis]AVH89204.1 Hypothetical protein NG00_01966 [Corynebacterium camporealensis]
MAAETERDLIEALVDLDEIIHTRGVGTAYEQKLFANPASLRPLRRDLEAMTTKRSVAPDAGSRLAAIAEAEALRFDVRRKLDEDT